jgi:phosphoglycolate phosphatase-like HAD superfamily hydrolase
VYEGNRWSILHHLLFISHKPFQFLHISLKSLDHFIILVQSGCFGFDDPCCEAEKPFRVYVSCSIILFPSLISSSSLPQNYMFREMRAALNIPKSTDILDHLHSLSTTPDDSTNPPSSPRQRANDAIETIEHNAMTVQTPQPGLVELMTYLDKRKVPKALCTRNFPLPVNHLLDTFLPGVTFSPVITRETEGVRPKPSPEGLWRIAESWGLHLGWSAGVNGEDRETDPLLLAKEHLGAGLIMVGDTADDMACASRANTASVLLLNEENKHIIEREQPDLIIKSLHELIEVLEQGFVGRTL